MIFCEIDKSAAVTCIVGRLRRAARKTYSIFYVAMVVYVIFGLDGSSKTNLVANETLTFQ